jgi:hypothetical protein
MQSIEVWRKCYAGCREVLIGSGKAVGGTENSIWAGESLVAKIDGISTRLRRALERASISPVRTNDQRTYKSVLFMCCRMYPRFYFLPFTVGVILQGDRVQLFRKAKILYLKRSNECEFKALPLLRVSFLADAHGVDP